MTFPLNDKDLWSVVLAGGSGERLQSLVQRWLGQHKPKQYCTFLGTRSMFQHTLDRSDRIVAPERRVTIIARDHELPIAHYTPTQIKRLLTGSGKASKEQIQRAIQRELGLDCILEPNDVADAAALALCHCYTTRSEQLLRLAE